MDAYPYLSQPIGTEPRQQETQKKCDMVGTLLSYCWFPFITTLLVHSLSKEKLTLNLFMPKREKKETIKVGNFSAAISIKTKSTRAKKKRKLRQASQ